MSAGDVRDFLRRHELLARRDLGQNFLCDEGLAVRLAGLAGVEPEDTVIEIGTGLGLLTRALASQARRVVTLEVDSGLVRALRAEHTLPDGVDFDPDTDVIAGNVTLPEGHSGWDGDEMLHDVPRWLVRPGDLVGVDQRGGAAPSGIYVPLDAIMETSGSNYVYQVIESPDGDTARRV